MIPYKNINLDELNAFLKNTMAEALGMMVTEIGPDFLTMRMPVDDRTRQPQGILNGGASLALAENVASFAGNLVVQPASHCVGLELNGNHLKSVKSGWVYATAKPIHLGKKTQVWSIDIKDENQEMVCISRMTLAVIPSKK